MPKMIEKIVGAILLAAGVAMVIIHYVVEGNQTYSYATLAVAAVLLVVGWMLFDRGYGLSRRWGGDQGSDNDEGPK